MTGHFAERSDRLMWLGLAAIGLGLSILLVAAWIEVMNNPGLSLADGYWIGRIPWTPFGVLLVLAGSAVTVVFGAGAIASDGDWLRRLLAIAIVLVPVAWWAMAVGAVPLARYEAPDPVALAYSLPETAALMLILPALAMAAARLAPIRPGPVHLRPVHPDR